MSRTYCAIDDVLALFDTAPTDKRNARFAGLLEPVTNEIIREFDGRDYFRHPDSGTETWTEDGNGSSILHLHYGLVELASLELSFDGGRSYVPVTSTDYVLRGSDPWTGEPLPEGEPYFHVVFTGFGSYTNFPPTISSARLVGARGYPAVPSQLRVGSAQRVQQIAYSDPSRSGLVTTASEYGGGFAAPERWPQTLYRFMQAERERFWCSIGGRR